MVLVILVIIEVCRAHNEANYETRLLRREAILKEHAQELKDRMNRISK